MNTPSLEECLLFLRNPIAFSLTETAENVEEVRALLEKAGWPERPIEVACQSVVIRNQIALEIAPDSSTKAIAGAMNEIRKLIRKHINASFVWSETGGKIVSGSAIRVRFGDLVLERSTWPLLLMDLSFNGSRINSLEWSRKNYPVPMENDPFDWPSELPDTDFRSMSSQIIEPFNESNNKSQTRAIQLSGTITVLELELLDVWAETIRTGNRFVRRLRFRDHQKRFVPEKEILDFGEFSLWVDYLAVSKDTSQPIGQACFKLYRDGGAASTVLYSVKSNMSLSSPEKIEGDSPICQLANKAEPRSLETLIGLDLLKDPPQDLAEWLIPGSSELLRERAYLTNTLSEENIVETHAVSLLQNLRQSAARLD